MTRIEVEPTERDSLDTETTETNNYEDRKEITKKITVVRTCPHCNKKIRIKITTGVRT